MDTSEAGRFGTIADRGRLAVVVGVPVLFWLVVELTANLGFLPVGLAAALGAHLYTRDSGQETVAASASGAGLLTIGLFLLQAYLTVAGGSTEPLIDTLVRLSGWLLVGVALVALGVWLREFAS